ncbi:hypothetical protein [Rhodococcus sp. MEB064]|uniref:hypothetical protein n=1 Tax=Rhodococcus sp. MEB064 TaxID=1587522 RepID=UPI0005AC2807|nr:hypothetical protein [Rhodococcus sp. MEB064]
MLKQTVGFALLGSIVAVLGAAAGQVMDRSGGGWMVYESRFADYDLAAGDRSLLVVVAVGAGTGAAIGLVARAAGVRTTSPAENRTVRVVAAGLLGVVVGLAPVLVLIWTTIAGLGPDTSIAVPVDAILIAYAISALLAYLAALVAVRSALRVGDDVAVGATVKAVAVALPFGAIAATAAGTGTAWLLGFRTDSMVWTVVSLVVALVLAAVFALCRSWAVRSTGTSRADGLITA